MSFTLSSVPTRLIAIQRSNQGSYFNILPQPVDNLVRGRYTVGEHAILAPDYAYLLEFPVGNNTARVLIVILMQQGNQYEDIIGTIEDTVTSYQSNANIVITTHQVEYQFDFSIEYDITLLGSTLLEINTDPEFTLDPGSYKLSFPITPPKTISPNIAATGVSVEADDEFFVNALINRFALDGIRYTDEDLIIFNLIHSTGTRNVISVVFFPLYRIFFIVTGQDNDIDKYRSLRKLTYEDMQINAVRVVNRHVGVIPNTSLSGWINRVSTTQVNSGTMMVSPSSMANSKLSINVQRNVLNNIQAEEMLLAAAGSSIVGDIFNDIAQYFLQRGMMDQQLKNALAILEKQAELKMKEVDKQIAADKERQEAGFKHQLEMAGLNSGLAARTTSANPGLGSEERGAAIPPPHITQSFQSAGIMSSPTLSPGIHPPLNSSAANRVPVEDEIPSQPSEAYWEHPITPQQQQIKHAQIMQQNLSPDSDREKLRVPLKEITVLDPASTKSETNSIASYASIDPVAERKAIEAEKLDFGYSKAGRINANQDKGVSKTPLSPVTLSPMAEAIPREVTYVNPHGRISTQVDKFRSARIGKLGRV